MVGKMVTWKTTASSTYNKRDWFFRTGFLEEGGRPEIQCSQVNPPSGALPCSPSFNSAAFLTTKFWLRNELFRVKLKKR